MTVLQADVFLYAEFCLTGAKQPPAEELLHRRPAFTRNNFCYPAVAAATQSHLLHRAANVPAAEADELLIYIAVREGK